MITKLYSATLKGVDAQLSLIEVDIDSSPTVRESFTIGGIGEYSTVSIKNRIMHAIKNSGYDLSGKRITVNITPALHRTQGNLFDLPIALAILNSLAIIHLPKDIKDNSIFCGELSLDGTVNPVNGALAVAFGAEKLKKRSLYVPIGNAQECARIQNIAVYGVKSLNAITNHLNNVGLITPTQTTNDLHARMTYAIDYADVSGQYAAKRAIQIAAAGFHNMLMIGSPGSGKTMIAERAKTIMVPLDNNEILETNKIYSISGNLKDNFFMHERPFRAPHHTISRVGLVGGGSHGTPGEISLAHNGILFLDELTEFSTKTIEVLRQPLEQRKVIITRADYSVELPANFLLIAACNPCPCGYYGDKKKQCTCSILVRENYIKNISGPFLDRIDIQVGISGVAFDELASKTQTLSSADLYTAVEKAVAIQRKRNRNCYNGLLSNQEIKDYCAITPEGEKLMEFAFNKLGISARSYHKILKLARTIADLDESIHIRDNHLKEALMYRSFDKNIS